MATMREHVSKMHERQAEFHTAAAKHCRQIASCAKASGLESAADITSAHEGLAAQHIDMAEFHVQACKNLRAASKAMGGMHDDDIVSDHVRILPTEFQRVRAVPRSGQPQDFEFQLDPAIAKISGLAEEDI